MQDHFSPDEHTFTVPCAAPYEGDKHGQGRRDYLIEIKLDGGKVWHRFRDAGGWATGLNPKSLYAQIPPQSIAPLIAWAQDGRDGCLAATRDHRLVIAEATDHHAVARASEHLAAIAKYLAGYLAVIERGEIAAKAHIHAEAIHVEPVEA